MLAISSFLYMNNAYTEYSYTYACIVEAVLYL